MTKRPSVLGDYLVSDANRKHASDLPTDRDRNPTSTTFRTSVYFHRKVHDKLRDIAHERRVSVAEIIHEGLDLWLVKEGFPTTDELKQG